MNDVLVLSYIFDTFFQVIENKKQIRDTNAFRKKKKHF